jgi:hypothetical protein
MREVYLEEFLKRIRGSKYKELVEHHVKRQDTINLLKATTGTISLLPDGLQKLPMWESFVDHMNKYIPLKMQGYTLWDMDCTDAFCFIIKEADNYLDLKKYILSDKIKSYFTLPEELYSSQLSISQFCKEDEELLFNIFQVITLGYAYNASGSRKIRKFMGIKKGFFG